MKSNTAFAEVRRRVRKQKKLEANESSLAIFSSTVKLGAVLILLSLQQTFVVIIKSFKQFKNVISSFSYVLAINRTELH